MENKKETFDHVSFDELEKLLGPSHEALRDVFINLLFKDSSSGTIELVNNAIRLTLLDVYIILNKQQSEKK